ncbi:GNAT family N-acetyltransferase, partial [Aegicerativicinus sediminis]
MTSNNFPIIPIKLKGETVKLKPLKVKHRTKLLEAAADGELWNLWFTSVPNKDTIDSYLDKAWVEQDHGSQLAFVVYHNTDKKIIGTTRYMNIDPTNRRLEIGHTWYSKSYQRTRVNTECKYLLLKHAFEHLKCIAVEFRTHVANNASRNAKEGKGAKE